MGGHGLSLSVSPSGLQVGGMLQATQKPSPQDIRRIAAEARLTEKTVRRFFRELPVQPTTRQRVEEAMRDLGIAGQAD